MEFLNFEGVKVPALGLGTWRLAGLECVTAVKQALAIGYRHIDTAQIYENEAEVGDGIKNGGVKRDEIFLTTKVWMDRVAKTKMAASVDESLKKLKTGYVDLLLIHWPVKDVPLAEQVEALKQIQAAGKARLIGVSNFTVKQMKDVQELGAQIASNQVEYHPFLTQKPVWEFCRAHGMFVTAYSPLARGNVYENADLKEIAAAHGKTPGQIALRWLIQQGSVAAIPKSVKPERMKENFSIFDFELSEREMQSIAALGHDGGRMISPDWAPQWDRAA